MKHCNKCSTSKPRDCFYKNKSKKDGNDNLCKDCRNRAIKTYLSVSKRHLQYKQENANTWKTLFKNLYGISPPCQCCGVTLAWDGPKKTVVHFDHRNGGSNVRPSDWFYSRPCTQENIQKWHDFKFGILCHNCNKSLPTSNRFSWLQRALSYATK